MASTYLDGSMIPRAVKREWEQRSEARCPASHAASVTLRGKRHSAQVATLSESGAMLILSLIPHIGETISVELAGRGAMSGFVCWVRGGKIGISFAAPVE